MQSVQTLLNDKNHAVLLTAVCLIIEIIKIEPKQVSTFRKVSVCLQLFVDDVTEVEMHVMCTIIRIMSCNVVIYDMHVDVIFVSHPS